MCMVSWSALKRHDDNNWNYIMCMVSWSTLKRHDDNNWNYIIMVCT
jgi:hypothetical protein